MPKQNKTHALFFFVIHYKYYDHFCCYRAAITRLSNWFHLYFIFICFVLIFLLSFKTQAELSSLVTDPFFERPSEMISTIHRAWCWTKTNILFVGGMRKAGGYFNKYWRRAHYIQKLVERFFFFQIRPVSIRKIKGKNISWPGFSCAWAVSTLRLTTPVVRVTIPTD